MRHATRGFAVRVNISACLARAGERRARAASGNLPDSGTEMALKIIDPALSCA